MTPIVTEIDVEIKTTSFISTTPLQVRLSSWDLWASTKPCEFAAKTMQL